MFLSRRMEHRINEIHEKVLCLTYPSDSKLTFKKLLAKLLATEIFKAKLNSSAEKLKELFSFNVRNLRRQSTLK